MTAFDSVRQVVFSKKHLTKAYSYLQSVGQHELEAVALFAGSRIEPGVFQVSETVCPKQNSLVLEEGLAYAVSGEELHRINLWLHKNSLSLIAQIHSHPTEAYHSSTDDRYPIVDAYGSISIVVPNFAQEPMSLDSWAFYRLTANYGWVELDPTEIQDLITLV